MNTKHAIHFTDSRGLNGITDNSIDLVVTSPPYPMIEMWDGLFCGLDASIRGCFTNKEYGTAFEKMHGELDRTWDALPRVMKEGAIACVNIGDATRSLDGQFGLFPNHVYIVKKFRDLGFTPLPVIIWRKTTNKPNKFMGSGMLPCAAYVTLEHEYILVFRKGAKRRFTDEQQELRRESAYFWEERNKWFSDIWTGLAGTGQEIDSESRKRSAAYPLELPLRLIGMFSIYNDTVLDPFWGTGTTSLAASLLMRNSTGFELDRSLWPFFSSAVQHVPVLSRERNRERILEHLRFLSSREPAAHRNIRYGFGVVTGQEEDIRFYSADKVIAGNDGYVEISYCEYKAEEYSEQQSLAFD